MPPLYDLDPPNEDFNYPDSFAMLDNVRYPESRLPITSDMLWKPSPGDTLRPDLWDGVLLSEILLKDEDVSVLLGNMERDGWPQVGMMKIKAAVTRACNRYAVVYCNRENRRAEEFYEANPMYDGPFRWWASGTEWDDGKKMTIDDLPNVRIRLSIDRAIPLIVRWCCCTFHYCRDMWVFSLPDDQIQDALELNEYINSLEPDDVEVLVGRRKKPPKIRETAKQRRARELAAMNPEERRNFLLAEENRKHIQALARAGKLDPELLEDSKNW